MTKSMTVITDSSQHLPTGSVVVDAFEFSDVSVLHHHRQEFDDDFGVGADEDLPLASLLRVVDALEGIGQYIHAENKSGRE